jgi:chromosomal replication initiator protein
MTLLQVWEDFLQQQEQELGADTISKWLRPLQLVRFDAGNLYLQCHDSFQALWFEEHMRARVQRSLLNSNGRQLRVHLLVPNASSDTSGSARARSKKTVVKREPPSVTGPRSDSLAPDMRLDSFVPHGQTTVAHRLLWEIGTGRPFEDMEPLGLFNPIYLFGPSGSGKTHLLMATAAAMRERGIEALFCRAETFTEHVIGAIRAGEMQQFRRAYRHVAALIVDDIQSFSRKGSTQEEFFHTFNTLHMQGKQLILSANCPPGELQAIEPRLVSRFEWGISLPLDAPQGADLLHILAQRSHSLGWKGTTKLLAWIVEEFPSGAKAAVRALEALVLRSHLEHLPEHLITTDQAANLLRDLLQEERQASLTAAKIIQAVADHFALPIEELRGESQTRECVIPRQLAMYLCRQKLRLPYMRIGELFNRDHSTVMSAIKGCQKALAERSSETPHHLSAILKRLDYLCKA